MTNDTPVTFKEKIASIGERVMSAVDTWQKNHEAKTLAKGCPYCGRGSACGMCGRCSSRSCNAGCIYCIAAQSPSL